MLAFVAIVLLLLSACLCLCFCCAAGVYVYNYRDAPPGRELLGGAPPARGGARSKAEPWEEPDA